jgi:hypothetical protein
MQYDVEAIRKKLQQTMKGKFNDPDEFRPEKAKSADVPIEYQFFVLPPLLTGDQLKSGKVTKSMDQFFVQHANHWINDKPYACPRVWDGTECPICSHGFELLKTDKVKNDEELRKKVVAQWMPQTYYMMNVYFAVSQKNPEDLRGRVMFYNAPKTIIDTCSACLMRDDAGDPESPEAFGVFFDENNAYKFRLLVLKQGRNNSYKTSKFVNVPSPICRNQDNTPNAAAIAQVLAGRHNLWDKIDVPDMDKIKKAYAIITSGDDEPSTGGGFDRDENAQAAAAPAGKVDPGKGKGVATATAKATTTAAAPKAAPKLPDDEDDVVSNTQVSKVTTLPDDAPPKTAAKAAPAPKAAPAADPLANEAPLPEDKGEGKAATSPEVDALLSQLEDAD